MKWTVQHICPSRPYSMWLWREEPGFLCSSFWMTSLPEQVATFDSPEEAGDALAKMKQIHQQMDYHDDVDYRVVPHPSFSQV